MSEIYRHVCPAHFLSLWLTIASCTMPGGYVELAELGCKIFSDDGTLTDESGFSRYLAHLADAMRRVGRPNATAEILTDRLWRAGFVDVEVVSHKQPFGPWPKDKHRKHIGAMTLLMAETGIFEAYGIRSACSERVWETDSRKGWRRSPGSLGFPPTRRPEYVAKASKPLGTRISMSTRTCTCPWHFLWITLLTACSHVAYGRKPEL